MTVNTTVSFVEVEGNGAATVFSFAPMEVFASSDLEVTYVAASGGEELLVEGTSAENYIVNLSSFPNTGTITYPADGPQHLPAGDKLIIKRKPPQEQLTDLGNQGPYNPQVQERQFDKLVMMVQDLQEQLDRALKLRISNRDILSILPSPDAGKVLAWNDNADGFHNIDAPTQGPPGEQGPEGPPGATGPGTGDLLSTANLSDLDNPAVARENLGVEIGFDVQAHDLALDAISSVDPANNKIPKFTGVDSASLLDFIDEDDMASNSAVAVPSQQSVKAYVDAAQVAGFSTGDVKLTLKSVADAGWVMMNDGTIGDGASGATTRANADVEDLYVVIWNAISNSFAPVTGGRGSSAIADFQAHKVMALPKALGRALAVSGAGSGLTSRALGETAGAETVGLVIANLPAHTHSGSGLTADSNGSHTHNLKQSTGDPGTEIDVPASANDDTVLADFVGGVVASGAHTHAVSGNTGSTGSSTAHANMQPTAFLNIMVKL